MITEEQFAEALLNMMPDEKFIYDLDFYALAKYLNREVEKVKDYIENDIDPNSTLDYWDIDTGKADYYAILESNGIYVKFWYTVVPQFGIDFETLHAARVYKKIIQKEEFSLYQSV